VLEGQRRDRQKGQTGWHAQGQVAAHGLADETMQQAANQAIGFFMACHTAMPLKAMAWAPMGGVATVQQ
jgi:hypothetical protein